MKISWNDLKMNLNDFYARTEKGIGVRLGYSTAREDEPWTKSDYAKQLFGRIFTGGLYTYRHFAEASRAKSHLEAAGHRILGAVEVIPVFGSLVAVAERHFCDRKGGAPAAAAATGRSYPVERFCPDIELPDNINLRDAFKDLTLSEFFSALGITYDKNTNSISAPEGGEITIHKDEYGNISIKDSRVKNSQNFYYPDDEIVSIDRGGNVDFHGGPDQYVIPTFFPQLKK